MYVVRPFRLCFTNCFCPVCESQNNGQWAEFVMTAKFSKVKRNIAFWMLEEKGEFNQLQSRVGEIRPGDHLDLHTRLHF